MPAACPASPKNAELLQQFAQDKTALEKRAGKLELELLEAREIILTQSEQLSPRTFRFLNLLNRRLINAGFSPRAVASFIFWLLRFK